MKIDVVIGNPPYQEGTGGGGYSEVAMPVYNKFITLFVNIGQIVNMIVPSRWMSGGKSVLDDFRKKVIEGHHLKSVHNFTKSRNIFNNVDIAGGVCILQFTKDKHELVEMNNCDFTNGKTIIQSQLLRDISKYTYIENRDTVQYLILVDNKAECIVNKIKERSNLYMDSIIKYNPFGLLTNFEDSAIHNGERNIRVIKSGGKDTYTDRDNIKSNQKLIDTYKIITGTISPDRGGVNNSDLMNVINRPKLLLPNEVCTMTYILVDCFSKKEEADSCLKYTTTKFLRFLIHITLSSMHVTSRNCIFIPIQDFTPNSDIDWSGTVQEVDEQLYKKYNLSSEEIDYIENTIKPME